jgi:hypothetical protein
MGEIAGMMLDGVMCQECGEFFEDGEAPGYPRSCAACSRDNTVPVPKAASAKQHRKRKSRASRARRQPQR